MKTLALRTISRMALVAVIGALLAACGGGDDDPDPVGTATPARYCELSGQLQQVAVGTGASSSPGVYDGTPEAVAAALDQMGATMDEMVDSAPDDIGGDVGDLVSALRAAAGGDASALTSESMTEASAQVSTHHATNCVIASDGGGDL